MLFADYSDPDVVRVGDDFYLVASSFSDVPGLPVLHSRDLVNWRIVAHALPRLPSPDFDTPQHGKGVWAPSHPPPRRAASGSTAATPTAAST